MLARDKQFQWPIRNLSCYAYTQPCKIMSERQERTKLRKRPKKTGMTSDVHEWMVNGSSFLYETQRNTHIPNQVKSFRWEERSKTTCKAKKKPGMYPGVGKLSLIFLYYIVVVSSSESWHFPMLQYISYFLFFDVLLFFANCVVLCYYCVALFCFYYCCFVFPNYNVF